MHIGAPLKRLGEGLSDEARDLLRFRAAKALENLVDLTIAKNAEFLVIAGDLYDGAEREAASQVRFRSQMERLAEKDIRVYIVHGNHDPTGPDLVEVVKLPSNVKVFKPEQAEVVEHRLRDGSYVFIAGISYWRPDVIVNLVPRLSAKLRELDTSHVRASIGILHTNVGSAEHMNYAPCTASDLEDSPFHYWALGHIHKRSINSMGANRYWAYPGNLQGRFFKESEPKGALVVPILSQGVGQPTLEPCDEIRFVLLNIDCSTLPCMDLIKEIAARCRDELPDTGNRSLIIRIVLHGQSSDALLKLDKLTSGSLLLNALHTELKDCLSGGGVDSIENLVEPVIDFELLKQTDSIIAEILKTVDSEDILRQINEQLEKLDSAHRLSIDELILVQKGIKADLVRKLLNLS